MAQRLHLHNQNQVIKVLCKTHSSHTETQEASYSTGWTEAQAFLMLAMDRTLYT